MEMAIAHSGTPPPPPLPNSCKNIKQSKLFTTLSWHPRHNQNLTILRNKNQANEEHLYLQLPYKLCFAVCLSVICFRKNMVPKRCTICSLPSVKECEDTFSMSLGKAVANGHPEVVRSCQNWMCPLAAFLSDIC